LKASQLTHIEALRRIAARRAFRPSIDKVTMSPHREEKDSRTVRLRDGRWLGYAEYGDVAGAPIVYLHGFPGSRLEAALANATARRLGIRLLAADRPGFGLSDHQPGRRIHDWPNDVAQLADHLGLRRFAVLGISGGGPYAVACALALAPRATCLGLVGGLGPLPRRGLGRGMWTLNRLALDLARIAPGAVVPLSWLAARQLAVRPHRLLTHTAALCSACDRAVLERDDVRAALCRSFREAVRSGWRGIAAEWALYGRPWGLDLSAIETECHLWHGERDRIVAPAMARYQAAAIPGCSARFLPDEGHYSLPLNHMESILSDLVL
jgi:pimeloyl-ACP methyl ester carboxylesterase